MRRLLVPIVLLVVLVVAAPASASVPPMKAKRAEKLSLQAEQAKDEGKLDVAFTKAERALGLDPDNPRALFVRGAVLLMLAPLLEDPAESAAYTQAGEADMARLAEVAPEDDFYGSLARQYFTASAEVPLMNEPDPPCPDAAAQAWHDAENALNVRDLDAARAAYGRALEGCPDNPRLWLFSGDVYFLEQDLEEAEARYGKALELAPCYWVAWRFTASVRAHGGDLPGAWQAATMSVACNPGYELGWQWLGSLLGSWNGSIQLPLIRRPQLVEEPGGDVQLVMPQPGEGPEAAASSATWLLYALEQASMVASHDPADRPEEMDAMEAMVLGADYQRPGPDATALEKERFAITLALGAYELQRDPAVATHPELAFWELMRAAQAAELLDEAILVLFFERALVPDLLAASATAEGRDRLAGFVRRFLAPAGPLELLDAAPAEGSSPGG